MRHLGSFRHVATALSFSWILLVLTPQSNWAAEYKIDLIPDLDQIGSQIETVQVYRDTSGDRVAFGIYDTGASVISFSAEDQEWFQLGLLSDLGLGNTTQAIPPIPGAIASAQGIGGDLTGNVSAEGTILADGLHAFNFNFTDVFGFTVNYAGSNPVPNVKAFLGNASGSPLLPTITGTPIHNTGLAAQIDLQGYQISFDIDVGQSITIDVPDLHFVPHDTVLPGDPVRIPLQLVGEHLNPNDSVTSAPNPVQSNVTLHHNTNDIAGKTFLFDTGAQMSIISTKLASDLGLNLATPDYTIDVQGAAGVSIPVPGFTIEALDLPLIDGGYDTLKLTQVPVFVLDLGVEGLDGILGMNLWNTAVGMLYNPYDPDHAYVDMTFAARPDSGLTQEQIDELSSLNPLVAFFNGALRDMDSLRKPSIIPPDSVPEPSTWILLTMGMTCLLFHGLREKLRNRRH